MRGSPSRRVTERRGLTGRPPRAVPATGRIEGTARLVIALDGVAQIAVIRGARVLSAPTVTLMQAPRAVADSVPVRGTARRLDPIAKATARHEVDVRLTVTVQPRVTVRPAAIAHNEMSGPRTVTARRARIAPPMVTARRARIGPPMAIVRLVAIGPPSGTVLLGVIDPQMAVGRSARTGRPMVTVRRAPTGPPTEIARNARTVLPMVTAQRGPTVPPTVIEHRAPTDRVPEVGARHTTVTRSRATATSTGRAKVPGRCARRPILVATRARVSPLMPVPGLRDPSPITAGVRPNRKVGTVLRRGRRRVRGRIAPPRSALPVTAPNRNDRPGTGRSRAGPGSSPTAAHGATSPAKPPGPVLPIARQHVPMTVRPASNGESPIAVPGSVRTRSGNAGPRSRSGRTPASSILRCAAICGV